MADEVANFPTASKRAPSRSPQPPTSEGEEVTPISRRALRLEKRLKKSSSPSPNPIPSSDNASSKAVNQQRQRTPNAQAPSTPTPTPLSLRTLQMPPASPIPLLVASIGNPGPKFASTLHSAGHSVLEVIRELVLYTPFATSKPLGGGQVSYPPNAHKFGILSGYTEVEGQGFTLWQSPAFMNESGPSVRTAYRKWLSEQAPAEQGRPKGLLVVVHDEMELPFGSVKLRDSKASFKGHNGLKSIGQALGKQERWLRIGVGIDRPTSRDPDIVSRYVLGKMTGIQKAKLESSADQTIRLLREIEEGRMP